MSERAVGIVGGVSAESTLWYYRRLIELSRERLEPDRTPRILIANMNFEPIARWSHAGEWEKVAGVIGRELGALERAGADFAAIAANTMHKVLPELPPTLPILSIVEAVAGAARASGWNTLGLTGTRFTMSDRFYQRGLTALGVGSLVPGVPDQERVHAIIYDELVRGVVSPESARAFAAVARRMLEAGADAVLLGCTELAMLTRTPEWDSTIPSLDSSEAHVRAIFETCLGERPLPAQPA